MLLFYRLLRLLVVVSLLLAPLKYEFSLHLLSYRKLKGGRWILLRNFYDRQLVVRLWLKLPKVTAV